MTFRRHGLLAAAALLTGLPLTAPAIINVNDDIELEGFGQSQNILRRSKASTTS